MDNETREKLRPVLYLAAGAYLMYLAVHMLQGLADLAGTEYTVMLAGAVVFGIAGIGILIFGLFCAKKIYLDVPTEEKPEEPMEKDNGSQA